MKRSFLLLFFSLYSIYSFAQTPQKFSYQAIIRNSSNTLLINTSIGIKVSIIQGSINGTSVYSETHNITTDANGLITLEIGGGTVVQGAFASIDWSTGPYFVKTETDPNGGANYTLISTAQLLSVPYALYAERSGNASSGGFQHYVGEIFGGGVVFYVTKDTDGKEHGLIVSPVNISDSLDSWSNVDTLIGIGARSYDDGLSNTNIIISQPGHINSAALLCTKYKGGGFSDWYLPALAEFDLIIKNLFTVNQSLKKIQGSKLLFDFNNATFNNITKDATFKYWTSSENPSYYEIDPFRGKFVFVFATALISSNDLLKPSFYDFYKNARSVNSSGGGNIDFDSVLFPAVRAVRRF